MDVIVEDFRRRIRDCEIASYSILLHRLNKEIVERTLDTGEVWKLWYSTCKISILKDWLRTQFGVAQGDWDRTWTAKEFPSNFVCYGHAKRDLFSADNR